MVTIQWSKKWIFLSILSLAPLSPSVAQPKKETEKEKSEQKKSTKGKRNLLKQLMQEPLEGTIEAVQDSFWIAWDVTKGILIGGGIWGWIKKFIEGFVQYGLILGIYHIFNDERRAKLRKLFTPMKDGKSSGTDSVGEFFKNYWSYFLKFAVTSLVFSFLVSWIKDYIEALMGKTREKGSTTSRVCVTIVRTLFLWLVIYDPLVEISLVKKLLNSIGLEQNGFALLTLLFSLVIFITAEFLIKSKEEDSKKEHPLKTLFKGAIKGLIASCTSACWAVLVKKDALNVNKINTLMSKKFGLSLWDPEKERQNNAVESRVCKKDQDIQNAALVENLALFALIGMGGCNNIEDGNNTKEDRLASIGVQDGDLWLLTVWEMWSLCNENPKLESNNKEELEEEEKNDTASKIFSYIQVASSYLKALYNKLGEKQKILAQALLVNSLLMVDLR